MLRAARLQKVVEQDGRHCGAERCRQDRSGLRIDRVLQGIPQQVETEQKEEYCQETHQASEGASKPFANTQGFRVM